MYDAENNASVYDVEYYPTVVLYSKGKVKKMVTPFTRKAFITFYNKYGAYPLEEMEDERLSRIRKEKIEDERLNRIREEKIEGTTQSN